MSRRQNSGSKWKEVLGFDDGSSSYAGSVRRGSSSTATTSPPASTYSRSNYAPSTKPSTVQRDSIHRKEPVKPIQPTYPRFPRDITFFRSKGDLLLSPTAPAPSLNDIKPLPAPPPVFYITIQKDPLSNLSTGRPDIVLHSGPSKSATIICFAKFHSVTLTTELTLCPPAPTPMAFNFSSTDFASTGHKASPSLASLREIERPQFRTEKLTPSSGIFTSERHGFSHTLLKTNTREKFEWRSSSRSFSRSFDEDSDRGGLKLVRVQTGDVVAVYAGLGQKAGEVRTRVVGMFRFLQGEGDDGLGEDFEVLAVVSLLSIVEKGRRTMKAHRDAFGIR